ncbi:AraC family transcriptional regulator [Marinicrinis lubricantis]|uniref:AraC family transcriptional regulator n=1 Tax=Marinicrinis lubricantis TaxID=2086470 RepID=A0ABW1INB0_9BACL
MNVYYNSTGTIQIDYMKRTGYFTMTGQHSHDGYELYYLFNGERDYFIRDRTYRVERGSFVFIEKEELHKTVDTGVPNHERVVFNFAASLLSGFPLQGRSGVVVLPPQVQYKGETLVRELIAEAKGDAAGRDLMLELLLRQLLLLVLRSQAEQPDPEVQPSLVHRTMSEVAAYVGAHYPEPLLLKDVAKRFFVSPYYLSRKFKQCTGFGFSEYVQLVRIREAQRLLRETDFKMIEIAERTGIGPVANFHKLFRKMNGDTPLQYRKRQQALIADEAQV